MDTTIYITGHKNPDTDSISATLAYGYLKKELGFDVTPIRLGNLNAETRYILERFNLKEPELRYDIRPTIKDLDFDDPIIALVNEPIKDVWHKMLVNKKKATAVVSDDGKLVGVASITDITTALLSLSTKDYHFMQITPLENIIMAVDGRLVYNNNHYSPSGKVIIGTSSGDDFNKEEYSNSIVITSARKETQILALKAKAAVVIATETVNCDPEVLAKAKEYDCCLITCGEDLISVTQAITQAIPIGFIMTENLVTFGMFDYLDDVREIISKSRFRQYPIVDSNQRVVGMLSRYHFLNSVRKKVILVDHNELSQSVEGIEEAEILEIIDHHRLGDISTDLPVYFRNEICGSSSTIISELFEENSIVIPKDYAGLMVSAIISDTINFHSPTCTPKDHLQAKKLAEIADLDLEELGKSILEVSASLTSKTAGEIVNTDIKEFNISSFKLAVGQVNILNKSDVSQVKQQVNPYLESYCLANRLDIALMVFSLTDGSGSYILAVGREVNYLWEAFDSILVKEDDLDFLPAIVSRKQQIIPLLSKYLQSIRNR